MCDMLVLCGTLNPFCFWPGVCQVVGSCKAAAWCLSSLCVQAPLSHILVSLASCVKLRQTFLIQTLCQTLAAPPCCYERLQSVVSIGRVELTTYPTSIPKLSPENATVDHEEHTICGLLQWHCQSLLSIVHPRQPVNLHKH